MEPNAPKVDVEGFATNGEGLANGLFWSRFVDEPNAVLGLIKVLPVDWNTEGTGPDMLPKIDGFESASEVFDEPSPKLPIDGASSAILSSWLSEAWPDSTGCVTTPRPNPSVGCPNLAGGMEPKAPNPTEEGAAEPNPEAVVCANVGEAEGAGWPNDGCPNDNALPNKGAVCDVDELNAGMSDTVG